MQQQLTEKQLLARKVFDELQEFPESRTEDVCLKHGVSVSYYYGWRVKNNETTKRKKVAAKAKAKSLAVAEIPRSGSYAVPDMAVAPPALIPMMFLTPEQVAKMLRGVAP